MTQMQPEILQAPVVKLSDFSILPGGRYRRDTDFSAQEFAEDRIFPAYIEAKNNGEKLIINLDGTAGFAASFAASIFEVLPKKLQEEKIEDNIIDWATRIKVICADDKIALHAIGAAVVHSTGRGVIGAFTDKSQLEFRRD